MYVLLQGKALECANEVRLQAHEVETVLADPPPMLQLDQASVSDAKWFNRRWVIAQSKGSFSLTGAVRSLSHD